MECIQKANVCTEQSGDIHAKSVALIGIISSLAFLYSNHPASCLLEYSLSHKQIWASKARKTNVK